MKRILLVILISNLFVLFSYGQEIWTKIKPNLYFSYESITKEQGAKVGWFKIIQPQKSTYKLEKYKVYCKSGIIEVKHTKIYDSDDNMLEEEINENNIGCDYHGVDNGEIYVKELCAK